MADRITRRVFGASLGGLAGSVAILRYARGDNPIKLRCSLDTAPSHVRNVSIVDFLQKVEAATGGQVVGEVFHSGQLYPDLNVGKALLQGQVDMAAPGSWTQTGIVPDCDFCQLPAFYGQPIDVTHRASDGAAGQYVARQVEAKLRIKILGPWIDLGFQNWYTTKKPVHSTEDLKGLKLRSPGGPGISWRISFVGGIPNTTAWPNVPLALSQGTFDGFVSTNESCATAKLWEAGVRYSYQDHQYVGQYMPMVSQAAWGRIPAASQAKMIEIWAANIGTYRANAAAAQDNARKTMEANGVTFTDPTADQLTTTRKAMQADVAALIQSAKLSAEVVKLADAAANGSA